MPGIFQYRAASQIIKLPDVYIQQKFKLPGYNQMIKAGLFKMYVRFVHIILPGLLREHFNNPVYPYRPEFDIWFFFYLEYTRDSERGVSSFFRGEISNNIEGFFPYLTKSVKHISQKMEKKQVERVLESMQDWFIHGHPDTLLDLTEAYDCLMIFFLPKVRKENPHLKRPPVKKAIDIMCATGLKFYNGESLDPIKLYGKYKNEHMKRKKK